MKGDHVRENLSLALSVKLELNCPGSSVVERRLCKRRKSRRSWVQPPSGAPSSDPSEAAANLGPRRNEKTAEPRITIEKISSECWSPVKNAPVSAPAILLFPTMATSLAYGMSAVISAIAKGMLATMLVLMIVLLTPEEIPRLLAGTAPMTELALGLRKRPMPNPISER